MKFMKLSALVCLALMLLIGAAAAQEKPDQAKAPAPVVFSKAEFPLQLPSGEYSLLSIIFDFPPGAGVPEHFHGGQTLTIVLSGEITLREKGMERTIKAGESWTERPGDTHSAINLGNANARVAVSMLLPKGSEPTTVIKK